MKIVIFSQTFPFTPNDATAHFMYDFARGFSLIGQEVSVLLPYHPNLKPNSFKPLRVIPFHYIWPPVLSQLGFGQTLHNDQSFRWFVYLLAPFYFLFGFLSLYRLVRRQKIDCINAHWVLPNGFIAAIVARLTGVPLIIILPGSDVYLAGQNVLFKAMATFSVRTAQKIVSNSSALLLDLGVTGEVISYGVPQNPGRRVNHKKPVVATAGRAVEKKGFALLQEVYPATTILSGLPIDQFRKKLLSVDIFVVPSVRDVKGNLDDASVVLLEAMSAGCAVIATYLPGNRTVIRHNVNGLLVLEKESDALAFAINRLLQSGKLRQRLGKAARRTISQHFTPEKIAAVYMSFFGRATTR